MRPIFSLILLLAASPLAGQNYEFGLMLGTQRYGSYSYSSRGGGTSATTEQGPVRMARFAFGIPNSGPVGAQFSMGYQPQADTRLNFRTRTPVTLSQSMLTLGFGLCAKTPLFVGAHLEYRTENLNADGESNTYPRLWGRFNLGYTFASIPGKPFIGLESSLPLTSPPDVPSGYPTTEERLRALASQRQSGIYVGVRF